MPVSQKPRPTKTPVSGKIKRPITSKNGLNCADIIRPFKWVWHFKKDKSGNYQYRDGKLLVDREKSGWIEDVSFKRRYGHKADYFGFTKPTQTPIKRITDDVYLKHGKTPNYSTMSDKAAKALEKEFEKELRDARNVGVLDYWFFCSSDERRKVEKLKPL